MPSTALEKFKAKHAEVKKKIFGAPIDWAKVFANAAPMTGSGVRAKARKKRRKASW